MSKYTYKNTSDRNLLIVGVGEVKAGATVSSDREIIHPALEPVEPEKKGGDAKNKAKQEPDK